MANGSQPKKDDNVETLSPKEEVEKQEGGKSLGRFNEIGTTGLNHWSGRIDEEWLQDLKGEKKYKILTEMRDNDPIIGAILFAIDMMIRQVDWRVQEVSEDEKDVEAKEFLDSCMNDMSSSWESTISEVMSMLPFGFSYHEIVYKRRLGSKQKDGSKRSKHDDGRIGWRKLPIRAQETLDHWELDEGGGVQSFIQLDPVDGFLKTIPIEKALLFRTTSHKGNPEGRPVIRNAYRPWFFKRRIEEIEGIGIERDLAGLPVIYAPSRIMATGANVDDQATFGALKDIARNIRRDEQEGIVMPGDRDDSGNRIYELELLSTGGSRQFDTDKIISRYDQRIAMTVLADFILLGHEKVGSFALSDSKTSLFAVALRAWLDEIKSVFNKFAIPRLFGINGFNLEELPTLEYGDLETPDLKVIAEYISKLSGAGAELFPDKDLENYLRKIANWPEKIEDDIGTEVDDDTDTEVPGEDEDKKAPDEDTEVEEA